MKKILQTILLGALLLPTIALGAVSTWSQGGTNYAGPYASNTVIMSDGTKFFPNATSSLGFPSFATLLNYVTTNTAQTITGLKTFTLFPEVSGVPTTTNQLTNKAYVDSLYTTGSRFVDTATAGTIAALPANTYNNGASGVGATLTGNVNGALPAQDGVTLTAGQTLLVKNESTQANNGYYDVTTVGNAGTPYVLTRHDDYNQSAEVIGGTFFNIANGTTQANKQYIMNNYNTITVGTTAITFALLSASNVYTASSGISLSGFNFVLNLLFNGGLGISGGQVYVATDNSTIVDPTTNSNLLAVKDLGITAAKLAVGAVDLATTKVTGILGIAKGGTGLSTTPTNGQLLIGNGTGYTASTLTAGSNITITNGAGSISIASSGGGGSATTSLGATIIQASFISTPQTAQTWTNMPITDAEIFAATSTTVTVARIRLDLTRGNIYRLVANQLVAGFTGATLRLQCSPDQTTWTDAGTDGTIGIGVLSPQPRTGNWSTLASACKGDVYLRLVGVGGNAVSDPSFRELMLQVQLTQPASGSSATSTVPVSIAATPQTTQAWTNQPIALTELFGNTNGRFRLDTTNASSYRLLVNQDVAGFANARLFLQCSADNTTFASSSATSADVLDIGTGTGVKTGAVATLSPSCIGDKYFRIVGQGGNATADPAFRQIQVQFTFVEQALGGVNDWSYGTNFGRSVLTPSSTIPVWIKDALYASTSLNVQGINFATTTIGDLTNTLTIGAIDFVGGKIPYLRAFAENVGALLVNKGQFYIQEDAQTNAPATLGFISDDLVTSATIGFSTTTGQLAITSPATTTSSYGFDIGDGCYAIAGVCTSGGGSTLNLTGSGLNTVTGSYPNLVVDGQLSGTTTTALAEGSNLYYTDARVATYLNTIDKGYFFSTTSADYYVQSSTTIPKTYTNNTFTGSNIFNGALTIGSLNGPLQANAGAVSATTSIGVRYGGTGLTTAPSYGNILVGNNAGGYTLTPTSSLGISSGGSSNWVASSTYNTSVITPTTTIGVWAKAPFFASSTSIFSGVANFLTDIGIGTTTVPTEDLEISTTGSLGPVIKLNAAQAGAGAWALVAKASANLAAGDFGIYDYDGAAYRFNITSAGNVGINNTAPSSLLDIATSTAVTGRNDILTIRNTNITANTEAGIFFSPSTAAGNIRGAAISGWQEDGSNSIGLKFYTGVGSGITEKMVVRSSGNVGIGTTTPEDKLVIENTGNSNNYRMLRLQNYSTGNAAVSGMEINAGANTNGGLIYYRGSGYTTDPNSFWFNNVQNAPIIFANNNSEKARFAVGGNFGIATTSPTSLLSVGGDVWLDNPSSATTRLRMEGSEVLRNDGASQYLGNISGTSLPTIIRAGGSDRIYASNSAVLVGIGTTTPARTLTVWKSGVRGELLLADGSATVDTPTQGGTYLSSDQGLFNIQGMDSQGSGTGSYFTIDQVNGLIGFNSTTPKAALSVTGNGTGTGLLTQLADSGNTPRVTILDNGAFGIGTTSPFLKLSVNGSIVANGLLRTSSIVSTSTNATSTFAYGINLTGGCVAINSVCLGSGGSSGGWTDDGSFIRLTTATDNVGIGGSTSTRSKLVVSDSVNQPTLINIKSNGINQSAGIDFNNSSSSSAWDTPLGNFRLENTWDSVDPVGSMQLSNGNYAQNIMTWDVESCGFGCAFTRVGINNIAPTDMLQITRDDTEPDTAHNLNLSSDQATGEPDLVFSQTTTDRATIRYEDTGDKLQIAASALALYSGAATPTTERLSVDSSGNMVFNETGADANIRMESDTDIDMFILDAGLNRIGISTSTPFKTFSIDGTVAIKPAGLTTNTGASTYSLCLGTSGEVTKNSDAETCIASSERFKKNIGPLTVGLDEVLKLQAVTFEMKEPSNKGEKLGFIAEATQKVDPRLVSLDEQGLPNGIHWSFITTLNTKAIQELNTKIDNLKLGKVVVEAKRSAEENWQWLAIALLALVVGYQGYIIRKIKK